MVKEALIGCSKQMLRARKALRKLEGTQRAHRRGMGPPPRIVEKQQAFRMPPSWYDRIIPIAMTKYLKPYAMLMTFSNRFVTAQVFDERSKELVVEASTKEKVLRSGLESLCDTMAAAKVGATLGERLKEKGIPGVAFRRNKGEIYHGKRKAFLDNLRDTGIKLV